MQFGVCYRANCRIVTLYHAICYCANCRILTLYCAICKIVISYSAICKVGVCYRAICMIGISHHAICKVGVCYHAIGKIGITYRAICKRAISYSAICKVGVCYRGICKNCRNCRNFLRDASNARLNFRKSCLWWFRNHACGDLTGTNGIEKDMVHGPPGLVWGKGLVWLSVSEVLIWSGRKTRPSFDIFVVCSTLILSGGWWRRIWSFFLILFEGKRRWGEFKIGLIVLAKSKPRGAFHHAAFMFALST